MANDQPYASTQRKIDPARRAGTKPDGTPDDPYRVEIDWPPVDSALEEYNACAEANPGEELWRCDVNQDPIAIQPRRPNATPNHTEVYLPEHNVRFARPPESAQSAFVAADPAQLAEILSLDQHLTAGAELDRRDQFQ